MAILVKLSSSLRRHIRGYDPMAGLTLDGMAGRSLAELIENLGLPEKEIKISMVNGRHAHRGQKLNEGDRVGLFPAVGGG